MTNMTRRRNITKRTRTWHRPNNTKRTSRTTRLRITRGTTRKQNEHVEHSEQTKTKFEQSNTYDT